MIETSIPSQRARIGRRCLGYGGKRPSSLCAGVMEWGTRHALRTRRAYVIAKRGMLGLDLRQGTQSPCQPSSTHFSPYLCSRPPPHPYPGLFAHLHLRPLLPILQPRLHKTKMQFTLFTFVLPFIAAIAAVSASALPGSNAYRLAHGMGPARPRNLGTPITSSSI